MDQYFCRLRDEPKKEQKQKQDGLVVDWINDFEDCEDWRAVSTCPLGDTKTQENPRQTPARQ